MFQAAVMTLSTFPSISEIENIAIDQGFKAHDLKDRPNPIEWASCPSCDGNGLVEVALPDLSRSGYASCPKCENGNKQTFWNNYKFEQAKKREERDPTFKAYETCPSLAQAKSWGYVRKFS